MSDRAARLSPALLAALLMLFAVVCFSAMAILIRMASDTIHPLQIVFFRNFFALLLFTPLLARGGLRMLKSPQIGLHLLRGANGLMAMTAFFTALSLIPAAEVTALGFTMPLFATIGAVIWLGEVVRWRRIAALGVGFGGVMIVLWPNIGAPSVGMGLALAAAALIAAAAVMVKMLTRTDSPASISIWMVLVQTPLALIPALFVWRTPVWSELVILLAIAAFGSAAHLAWARASSLVEISQLQPIEFAKLPIVALLGFLLFAESPSLETWIGGGVIFAATTVITWREAQLARSARAGSTVAKTP